MSHRSIKGMALLIGLCTVAPVCIRATPGDSVRAGMHVQGRFHYGFVMTHTKKMGHLVTEHSRAWELTLSRSTTGKRDWERSYRYPEIGLMLFHGGLGNPELIGRGTALVPFLDLGLSKRYPSPSRLRIATGPGYIRKTFHRLENHKNNAVSAHINMFVQFLYNRRYVLSPAWRLHTGIGLTHFSNGGYKAPNLGLNLLTVSAAFSVGLPCKPMPLVTDAVAGADKRWRGYMLVAAGLKEISPPGGPDYTAVTLSGGFDRYAGFKGKYGGQADLFYDASVYPQALQDSTDLGSTWAGSRAGLSAFGGFVFGRLEMLAFQGVYVYSRYPARSTLYHRLTLRYSLSPRWLLSFSLKTHWANADYVEAGFGYRWNTKKVYAE